MQISILLVQPSYPTSHFPGPNLPVGLGYIAEQLEMNNIAYEVCDLSIDSKDEFFNQITVTCPEYIALSMMSLDVVSHYALALEIKQRFPQIKVIAGGAHVSFVKEKALRDCSALDFGIVHEGEQTIIELVKGRELLSIEGLLYRRQNGAITYNGPRKQIDNLDQLAFPRYRKFKLDRYGKTISLASSRGCPYSCTFCGAFLSMGKSWRARSVQSIMAELDYWQQKGYTSFNFIDSNFFMSKQRVIELCNSLSSRNINITLSSDGMRAKDADPVMLKKLKEFGLQSVAIGVESANDDILDSIKKGETLADLIKCLDTLNQLDIDVIAFFIIGLPGETIKHVLNSFKFALKYQNISAAFFFNPNPLPGTELYTYAEQHNMLRATESQILDNIGGMGAQILLETDELPIPARKKLLELSHHVSDLVKIRHQAYRERNRTAPIESINSGTELENYNNQLRQIINLLDNFEDSNEANNSDPENIFTHLTHEEKSKLTELATACAGKTYVEIGSYLGASSCFIASGIKNSGKTARLFCVDTWGNDGMSEGRRDTYNDFLKNTASFEDIIVPLRGKSDTIAKCFDKEIDFLFIDAGHDYEDVKADVLAWFPKLRAGAQVVFHDIGWAEGVQQVVKEQVLQVAYNEGSLPNMYWASVSQPLKPSPEETLHSLNQQRDPFDLIHRLKVAGIPVTSINLDINDFISWLSNFREVLERYSNSNDVIIEKCLEHYIAHKFSGLEAGHIYIDIAAAGSNWTDCLLQRGIKAYSLDLTYPEGIHGNKIGANAAETSLPENSIDAMSLQCAFETFQGDYDKLFIRESKRILKEGGKVVISPLYLDTRHFILSSKNTDISSVPLDDGAIRVWREDEYEEVFSRHYSPEALTKRIFSNLYGLSAKVFYINNLDEFRDKFPGQRIYCDFNLYLEKPETFSENQILLSVIIPTRNRAALLYNALEAITKQTFPASRYEVIIVDNGSTDATAEVCQHFKQRIPHLKYISAPSPGLHNGRHAGLKESIGEILVYADDDIEALPTWLEGVAESFSDPKIGIVGGKILPKFESQPPDWVAALSKITDLGWSLGWYSILDFGDIAHEIPHEYVWGCNFSIRKAVLNQAGGFHPDSFPQEIVKYRGDGETAVSIAVRNMGYKALYNPKASVYHVVSQKRLTQEYVYQRAFNQGISDSYSSIRSSRSYCEVKQYNSPANSINDIVNRGFVDGFNYHQQLAKSDEKLLAWILKESYIDCEDISL